MLNYNVSDISLVDNSYEHEYDMGIEEKYDKRLVLKQMRKKFACNGTIVEDEEYGEVIQLQGDHRTKVGEFLTKTGMYQAEQLRIHGY
ncbi:unnamed protein product [Rotaria sp. Silwood1]|nr:unnamed protein product [Rotaria sp. Silwood1]